MIRPERAPVRPRVYSPDSGDALPLEDILPSAEERPSGAIAIVGERGSGKSTALAHLAAMLPADGRIVFLDDPDIHGVREAVDNHVVVFTSRGEVASHADQRFEMVPWGEDERIEYLLAVHAQKCASVIQRLHTSEDGPDLGGNPELWRIVLDQMALDESLVDAREALRRGLEALLADDSVAKDARRFCRAFFTSSESQQQTCFRQLEERGCDRRLLRLLCYPSVRLLLAAEEVAGQLQRGDAEEVLGCRRPRELVREIARRVGSSEPAVRYLQGLVTTERADCQAMAASILHAARLPWTPRRRPQLSGAYLSGVSWSGRDLHRANLRNTDLSEADLELAVLDRADVSRACLRGAVLRRACLDHLVGENVDLTGADLSGATARRARLVGGDFRSANLEQVDLSGANLREADFTRARLCGARLEETSMERAVLEGADLSDAILREASLVGARFSQATLHGARFQVAKLDGCDLEYLEIRQARFEYATLNDARLTGSRMPGAKFNGAKLRLAGLADIDWEGADLRGADLHGASFHLGSSRSGLVDSPLASEGSRTGFYTDEFDQQYYKSPEEIRKANLRGADLRGAIVDGVDFYLVDLREAKYTDQQREHFRQCRAILADRA